MQEINGYIIIEKLLLLNDNINLWLAENSDGDHFEILTIAETNNNKRLLERLLANEIKPLVNREILGFQKTLETGFDTENRVYFIVYENFEAKLLLENKDKVNIESLKNIVLSLNSLYNENRRVFIISPNYIAVNEKGIAKLKFIGLFEFFESENLLENNYLSPNVLDWIKDKKKIRPNFQDDIYSLAKSFQFIFDLYDSENKIIKEIITKSLSENRIERFSKYRELVDLLEEIPVLKKNDNNRKEIKIAVKQEEQKRFEACLQDINESVSLLVDQSLSKEKDVTIKFSSQNWSGSFYLKEKDNFLICYNFKNKRDYMLLRDENSFFSEYNFSYNPSKPINCVSFFKEKYNKINHLAQLNKTKNEEIKLWRTLPKNEKEFIEERAFTAKYTNREPLKNSSNIKFQLVDIPRNSWGRIKDIKSEGVNLFIDSQKIGTILNYDNKANIITLKDVFCNIDEIPEKGELIEDIRQETSQYKKQVEACREFERGNIVNPDLCSILATPDVAELSENSCLKNWDYENFKEEVYNKNLENDNTQRDAVLEALHHKPLYLIQGPPGTGKTTVIVELIRQIIKRQKEVKILVTSQSNLAVDNVLEKLHEINENENSDIEFMRLASENEEGDFNVSKTILQHTFENKLKNWIAKTEKKSKNYFSIRFSLQEKQKILIEFYEFFSLLNKEKDWNQFKDKLRVSGNYIKKIFENSKNFKDVQLIFEKQLGKDFLKLKNIQRDWVAFLNGVTINDGKDRKKSMLNDGSKEIDFLTAMMMKTNVIGATCIHIASSKYSKVNFRFDYVIMDESSKATPAETLVPINMGKNIILIGDHKQLPPVVTREDAIKDKLKKELDDNGLDVEKEFGESLFEKLVKSFENDESKKGFIKMLDIQYRMPKQVGSLISKYFYDNDLKNPEIEDFDEKKSHQLKLKKDTSIIFFSTSQRENPFDNDIKTKRENSCNVKLIKEILEQLNQKYSDNLEKEKPFTIGIIAGYRGQVELLQKSINLSKYSNFLVESKGNENNKVSLIEINTVDKFQGAERDIIIYDIVRSSKSNDDIGFLVDYRRINVAFSRVKRLLIVVGDSEYLIKKATFRKSEKFPEFKLQKITEELQKEGLIFNHFEEIF